MDKKEKKMIKQCIKYIEWDKIQSAMKYFNWTWAGKGVPTLSQLQETATRLLTEAVSRANQEKCTYTIATGGLQAVATWDEKKKDVCMLTLSFVLTDWIVEKDYL